MSTETSRNRLYEKIRTEWGEDNAEELMSALPPVGWADIATKQDLALVRGEVKQLGVEIRAEMNELGTELRTEMNELGTELRTEMNQLGTELRTEMNQHGTEVRVSIAEGRAAHADDLRTHLYWIIGTMIGLVGIVSIIVGWLG
jgi:hypothetical protein